MQVKQQGRLTSDDYEMVDYMLNQFKTVIGINGNAKRKDKSALKGPGAGAAGAGAGAGVSPADAGPAPRKPLTHCAGYPY